MNGIGANGSLPWPFSKEDMKWFKDHTTNHVVVMGSKSWNDPKIKRPLPNRINVVVSRTKDFPWSDDIINDINDISNLEKKYPDKIIWICGGAQILQQTSNIVSKAFITRFHDNFNCDTFIDLDSYLKNFLEISKIEGDRKTFVEYKCNHISI